jgi:hypothetical protein
LSESISLRFRSKIKLKEKKNKMKILKNKIAAITIAILFILSMTASAILIPTASAHTPAWQIPTYAYINATPSTIGVGQTITVYMWLNAVYGAAGGTTAITGTTGATASAALTANNWRFQNYKLTITAPDGTNTSQTWAVVQDTTSNQFTTFTPTVVGTYNLTFTFPGQVYGAGGDGYSGSILINDTYLPSTASTTVTVQQTPIPAAVTSEPMPTNYWTRPIYGENSNWYTISSDWLGSGAPQAAGYTSSSVYHGDSVGPLTAHIMWTLPLSSGGTVGGNLYTNNPGVGYFEGSCYLGRFSSTAAGFGGQAIIVDGMLFYKAVVGFTGMAAGPFTCVNLQTGKIIWTSNAIANGASFAYIYNLWNGEQHGAFQPILFSSIGGGVTGLPSMWECFDAYTGTAMFNITGVPGFAPQTGQLEGGLPAVALTTATVPGPSSEQIKYVFSNIGTAANPNWYLSEWNSSKLWQYDVNPYASGGSLSPSVINMTNGALVSSGGIPITMTGTTASLPPAAPGLPSPSIFVPYGSSIIVNANIPINSSTIYPTNTMAQTTYDWNVSLPWLNTMPLQPTYSTLTGLTTTPTEQGTAGADGFAQFGTIPVTVVAADFGDVMLCRNGSLPVGFSTTSTGYPQLPYTLFAVNLNASRGAIGSILWMQNYNPPAGNLTISIQGVDWQTRTFVEYYEETMQFVGFSLTTGAQIWGPTASMTPALQYYELGYGILGAMAYGHYYADGMGGVLYAYNDLTGALDFTYGNGGAGNSTYSLSSPYGEYPTFVGPISGNGVVYLMANEHTVTDPIYKGAELRAINATTGKEIWTLSCYGSMNTPAIADGYAVFLNGYDMQVYTVGRGPSATTVEAPMADITLGSGLVIRGTVMDISAGTTQTQQAADFPNGVPVASDASMSDWMSYVYQQQPCPTNFTGVPVTISVLDSNGNYRSIGTATTDATGTFSLTWTPDIPGNYTVIASFAGTNGYWPSNSETSFAVDPAAPTASPYPVTVLPPTEMYIGAAAAAIIVAIAIGFAITILMLRKRP